MELSDFKKVKNKYKCPYCNKLYCKMGINSHVWRKHTVDGKEHKPMTGRNAWNKGLTKDDSDIIKNMAESISETMTGREGHKHTEETKRKISKSRTKYLKENPDQIPYLLYHSSKKSYPEKVFERELKKRNITGWKYDYQNGIYVYDFAWPSIKLDVEIDGKTHLKESVKRKDEKRDNWSKNEGWKVLRFTAREIKNDINACVEILLKTLNEMKYNLT